MRGTVSDVMTGTAAPLAVPPVPGNVLAGRTAIGKSGAAGHHCSVSRRRTATRRDTGPQGITGWSPVAALARTAITWSTPSRLIVRATAG
jgi:hypothetical protein